MDSPLHEMLRYRREALGLTQGNIVDRLKQQGYTRKQGTISRWELGRARFERYLLPAVAVAYEIEPRQLERAFDRAVLAETGGGMMSAMTRMSDAELAEMTKALRWEIRRRQQLG